MAATDKIEAFLAKPRNIIVAGTRKDGRPHLTPNWSHGTVSASTSRRPHEGQVRHFREGPRAHLLVDDSKGSRALIVPANAEIREDVSAQLPHYRAIRAKHGAVVPNDEELIRALNHEGRALLVFTPEGPPQTWTSWGLD
jgi:hypothetical protein